MVAPADGLACLIDTTAPPPNSAWTRSRYPGVSIFLSLLDAHVQRMPVSGEVRAVVHRPGTFHSADLAAASADNERNSVLVRTAEGLTWWSFRSPDYWPGASSAMCVRRRGGHRRYLRTNWVTGRGWTPTFRPARRCWIEPDSARWPARRFWRGRRERPSRPGGRRGLRILPSATTVLAICAGLTSIKFARRSLYIALALIGAAAMLDGNDGGIARALDAQSRMGAERTIRWPTR